MARLASPSVMTPLFESRVARYLSVAAVVACSIATTGCDAVRVEKEDEPAQGPSVDGLIVAIAPLSFGQPRLQRVVADAVTKTSPSTEAIDVATLASGGLEAAACRLGTQDEAADCSAVTVEFDSAVMDARGRFGAVVGVSETPQAAGLARLVADTNFVTLVGSGAKNLLGERVDAIGATAGVRTTDKSAKAPRMRAELLRGGSLGGFALVVRMADGQFAAAASTGGSIRMPQGRLTPVGIEGAAIYAGPLGAVAIDGEMSTLIRAMMAKEAYKRLVTHGAVGAAKWAVSQAPDASAVAVVVIDTEGFHVAGNRKLESVTVPLLSETTEVVEPK